MVSVSTMAFYSFEHDDFVVTYCLQQGQHRWGSYSSQELAQLEADQLNHEQEINRQAIQLAKRLQGVAA